MVTGKVRLTPVDEQYLEPLLSVAVAEAEPGEVMPPVEAPVGWSQARRDAFREFHRASYGGLNGPTRTQMYAILVDEDVVGLIRMTRRDEPETVETGIWLGQSARGQGIGLAALRELLIEAERTGVRVVVAETTPDNTAALQMFQRCGAVLHRDGDATDYDGDVTVRAEIQLFPLPTTSDAATALG